MVYRWLLRATVFTVFLIPAIGGNEKNYTYLALGDSIAFGYDPTVPVGPTLPSPFAYTGYPEKVAEALRLLKSKKLMNTSCPGETTASFMIFGAPDNGCYGSGPQGQPSFRFNIGLRADYPGTQLEFALQQLTTNKHINLVTLSIGGNELELIRRACTQNPVPDFQTCVAAQLQTVLPSIAANLGYILTQIRSVARYDGRIVLVNYYTPINNPLYTGAVAALNHVIATVGAQNGASTADVFTAFQLASALHDGDPCAAGLLVRLDPNTCDIHPSDLGKQVIAAAVLVEVGKKQ